MTNLLVSPSHGSCREGGDSGRPIDGKDCARYKFSRREEMAPFGRDSRDYH